MTPLDREKEQIELEKQRLALQKERVELYLLVRPNSDKILRMR